MAVPLYPPFIPAPGDLKSSAPCCMMIRNVGVRRGQFSAATSVAHSPAGPDRPGGKETAR